MSTMRTHPDVHNSPWLAEGEEKRRAVQDMFAGLSPKYDRTNRVMSLHRDLLWRRLATATLNLKPGDSALDLCTGTGDFMVPLRKAVGRTGRLIGVDFCEPMVREAVKKGLDAQFVIGDALAIPIGSNSVDAVTIGWGIRNTADIDAAHREIFRVLKPGGRFVSLDMAQPSNAAVRGVSRLFLGLALRVLGRIIRQASALTYLPESTLRFWSRERLSESMANAGFVKIGCRDLMFGNVCMIFGEKPQ